MTMDSSADGVKGYLTASFIGIIVAICGNIIISFALNCQKLAHKRLEESRSGETTPKGEENGGTIDGTATTGAADLGGAPSTQAVTGYVATADSPLLFKPNLPTRSYTDPITARDNPVLYTLHPAYPSPTTSPNSKRKHTTSSVSRSSTKTNGTAPISNIPEETEFESDAAHQGDDNYERTGPRPKKISGRARAISWVDNDGPGSRLEASKPVSSPEGPQGRFHSGVDETEYLKSRLW